MSPRRPTCSVCEKPQATCLCADVAHVANRVAVLLVQHPMEVQEAKGSARLLQLGLAQCQTLVGEQFEPAELDAALHAQGRTPVLLYPDEGMGVSVPALPPDQLRLVILDGTWRKSRKLLHLNPLLAALPRFALADPPPGRYTIRKAHAAHQLSTLEAACHALATLEGDGIRYRPMLDGFERFVARQLALAGRAHA